MPADYLNNDLVLHADQHPRVHNAKSLRCAAGVVLAIQAELSVYIRAPCIEHALNISDCAGGMSFGEHKRACVGGQGRGFRLTIVSGEGGGEAALRFEPHHFIRVGGIFALGALRLALLCAKRDILA